MKKNKRGILLLFIMLSMFLTKANEVEAGSVNANLNGKSIVNVGDNITIVVALDNIVDATDGIGSMDSTLEYDTTYFELVKMAPKSSMYLGFNEVAQGKIKQSGFATNEGLTGEVVNIWQVVLKAKTSGVATIKLSNIVVGDGYAQALTNNKAILTKDIIINEVEEVVAASEIKVNASSSATVNETNNKIISDNTANEIKEENNLETEEIQIETLTSIEVEDNIAEEENFFTAIKNKIAKSLQTILKQFKKMNFSHNASATVIKKEY